MSKIVNMYEKIYYNLKIIFSTQKILNVKYDNSKIFKKYFFIIGCHRSGTSLLRRILDSHKKVSVPTESKFLTKLVPLIFDKEGLEGLEGMGFSEKYVQERLKQFICSFYEIYAESKNKDIWGDKTPDYVNILNEMNILFKSECKYIFIYRHGLDVATSLYKRNFKVINEYMKINNYKNKFEAAAVYWADQCNKMMNSPQNKNNYTLRYEELTSNPKKIIYEVCKYLEIKFNEEMINYHKFDHDDSPYEDGIVTIRKAIVPSIDNYKKMSEKDILPAINNEYVIKTLNKLNYEI